MKPQFALSLSFEGIRLLHRAAGGWLDVGGVTLNSDDLAGELAVLRKTAASLEPAGVRSKLIIPTDQIKYLTIETKGFSRKQRIEAARAALVGATPYKVRDLSFDICPEGPRTHIAAVANETLAEAESFAAEHKFNPISFVAIPGIENFLGEPFFGPTPSSADLLRPGEEVEPDGIAVVVVGSVPPARLSEMVSAAAAGAADKAVPMPSKSGKKAAKQQKQAEPSAKPGPEAKASAAKDSKKAAKAETSEAVADSDVEPSAHNTGTTKTPDTPPESAVKTGPTSASQIGQGTAETKPKPEPETDTTSAPSEPEPESETKKTQAPSEPVISDAAPEIQFKSRAATDAEPAPKLPTAPSQADNTAADNTAVDDTVKETAARDSESGAEAKHTETQTPDGAEPEDPEAAVEPVSFASRRPSAKAPLVARKDVGMAVSAPALDVPLQPDSSSLDQPAPLVEAPVAVRTTRPVQANRKGGFLTRRKGAKPAAAMVQTPVPAGAVAASASKPIPAPADEADRMTVFGARRDAQIGGKPRFLGLILTAVLLIFLAGVAAWAAVFLDEGLASLFWGRQDRTVASAPEFQIEPQIIRTAPEPAETVQTVSLDPDLTEEDSAVLDALQEPQEPAPLVVISEAEAEARYAVTGIWPLAPDVPTSPGEVISLDDFYLTSIDPISTASDAVALPPARSFGTDLEIPDMASPAAAGTNFALDPRGMVIPTVEGAVSPDGVTVFAGRPPLVPPFARTRASEVVPVPEVEPELSARAGIRPRLRPSNLAEANERAQLDGLTRSELADFRPELRPQSLQEAAAKAEAQRAAVAAAAAAAVSSIQSAEAAKEQEAAGTQYAVNTSVRPDVRPRNFDKIVQRAQKAAPKVTQTAAAATVPRTVAPSIPSKTSVAKQATINNAINLRKVNLIGVYGKPSSRRALVRLGNGRYQKVEVGDRIDGGRVSAIGDSELRYTKGGRAIVLKMPKG